MREPCSSDCSKCKYWECDKFLDDNIRCADCKCKIACYNFSDYWDRIYASGDQKKIDSLWDGSWRDNYEMLVEVVL